MNGYKCFFRTETMEVYADTTRAAQLKAAKLWRVKPSKVYQVTAMLCEKADGEQVVHAPID